VLGDQHDAQIDQQPGCTILWMPNDPVDAGIYQDRGLNVALSLWHAALSAEGDDRQHAEDSRSPQADPSSPLERFGTMSVQDESEHDLYDCQHARNRR